MSTASTNLTYGERFLDLIQAHYGDRRSPAKALARDGKVSVKTGSNWLRRVCRPRCDEIFELMESNEVFAAEIIAAIEEKRQCRRSSSR